MSRDPQDGNRHEGGNASTINVETGEVEGTEITIIQRLSGPINQGISRRHQRINGGPFQQRWGEFYNTATYRRLCCKETGEFI
uniref:ORF-1 n=2 Tax=unclassified Paramyxoviridae TaxID=336871 RepID=C7EN38_9MONO|nr:ORF-1 [Lizard paramyxovirus]ACT63855.1 ORF-1 [Snake paramyxovirus]ACT63857.1 ORF-1 [Snake paramyxovirus]